MDLILILWLAAMSAILSLITLFISRRQQRGRQPRQVYRRLQRNTFHSKISRLSYTSPGLSGLWHQLLIRVDFDIETAESLIQDLKRKHPNKTDRWYIEKAIWDIEGHRSRGNR